MKTSTTFSMLFWLKQSKAKNGKVPLYARYASLFQFGFHIFLAIKVKFIDDASGSNCLPPWLETIIPSKPK